MGRAVTIVNTESHSKLVALVEQQAQERGWGKTRLANELQLVHSTWFFVASQTNNFGTAVLSGIVKKFPILKPDVLDYLEQFTPGPGYQGKYNTKKSIAEKTSGGRDIHSLDNDNGH